jgi:putative transposase
VFVKVSGRLCYLWRAVDHEGEVLEAVVTTRRDKAAAQKLLKPITKKYGAPRNIVTQRIRIAVSATRTGGAALSKSEDAAEVQLSSCSGAQNQFNQERHLVMRQVYKQRRSAALAERRALAA